VSNCSDAVCDARGLSVGGGMLPKMSRHTAFKFCLDPTVEQHDVLARHAGAARFGFNQCLGMVKTALTERRANPEVDVPCSGFDLINAFNVWKKTEDAGRVFIVDTDGVADVRVTGLAWRTQVCQQVFEEAAVDCGRALAAWSESRSGKRKGNRVGFPRFKKKAAAVASFRLRNKHPKGRPPSIRVGDNGRARSITLPGIGVVAVHDDTRRLRRMLAKGRAKVLFATVSQRAGRWWVSLNVEAADLHPGHAHPVRDHADVGGWVGVDRGLSAFLVAATTDGREVARVSDPPKALATGMKRQRQQRQLAKSLSRKQKGSVNRRQAAVWLGRHHHHVANVRQHFLLRSIPDTFRSSIHEPVVGLDQFVRHLVTTVSPRRSPMPDGSSSPGCWATNNDGGAVSSPPPTAGIHQANSARLAGPSTTH
jgi:putative transposase